ncbi:SMI1/KNR4 family protein [Streptomyces sp. NPDC056352]|uniref:SMI1/KNR4 family protein n=1 Tax=Streptomyces sp. NPDC056352 TaxID=3345791 RepID=UPI0035D63F62
MSEELSRWYRGRLVVGPFRPFGAGELEDLEREMGLPVPSSYRSFLEESGGGSLLYSVHVPESEPELLQSFDDLYQLGRDDKGEVVQQRGSSRTWCGSNALNVLSTAAPPPCDCLFSTGSISNSPPPPRIPASSRMNDHEMQGTAAGIRSRQDQPDL